ncbi:primosomal protein N' [bacterium CPR1]|nr:primosomal protein N' [bacterium CPR1]
MPDSLQGQVTAGSLVEVPFREKALTGVVLELTAEPGCEESRVKDILRLLEAEPFFGRKTLMLVEWMVSFYGATWRDTLFAVVPAPVLAQVQRPGKPRGPRRSTLPASIHYPAPSLLDEQRQALKAIRPGEKVLLYGVTGSGKTEVYLHAVEAALQSGRQAIVMVPEVALTPQAVERYRGRLGDTVGVLHSGLTAAERREQWWRLRRGELSVALGTRSAVFAPLQDPALFILDEEHDHSYKQDQTPRYHARQVAVRRAAQTGAAVVLGSATPSLESFYLAQTGYYKLLELSARVTGRKPPPVELVDMRRRPRQLLSQPLVERMRETLARDEQVVLLLNRRGFSSYLQCGLCGHVHKCPHCSISLTFHKQARHLRCHYCGHTTAPPDLCQACSSPELSYRGGGTERLESELATALPGVELARLDRDTTSRAGGHAEILGRFARKEARVLLGTQMVAKGLDFPDVTLVGVINADGGLNLPDFRASERTFQLLTQVAGRAGRGQLEGHVLVQTLDPENACLVSAAQHDYAGFYARELELRRQVGYPPFCRLVRLVVSGTQAEEVEHEALDVARILSARVAQAELLGPAPCPLEKVRGRWRWHLLGRTAKVQELVQGARTYFDQKANNPRSDLQWSVDPDPQDLL